MTSLDGRWVGILLKFATLGLPLVVGIVAIAVLADMREQPQPVASELTVPARTGPLAAR